MADLYGLCGKAERRGAKILRDALGFPNNRGQIAHIPTALIGLLTASLVLYIVMLVWQPIVVDGLFPLLNNAEAFRYGAAAITIMQVTVLVAAASILIVFFQEIKGGDNQSGYRFGNQ